MEEYVGNYRTPATGYTLVGYFHTSFFVAMDGNIYWPDLKEAGYLRLAMINLRWSVFVKKWTIWIINQN